MNKTYFLFICLHYVVNFVNSQGPFKIVNGSPVEPGSFPFVVSLGFLRENSYEHICGASIISNMHVLTAAHCVQNLTNYYNPEQYYRQHNEVLAVIVGANNLELNKDYFTKIYIVKKITRNLDQNTIIDPFDVAVLRLKKPIQFNSRVRPVKLPIYKSSTSIFGKNATVLGWGETENEKLSNVLLSAELTIINNMDVNNECKGFTQRHYCAKDLTKNKSKPCFGDSGGPLVVRENYNFIIYGIVSFTISDTQDVCKNPLPTIFTMVPLNLNWILKQIKQY